MSASRTVGSTGRRNIGIKFLCWGLELQGFTWDPLRTKTSDLYSWSMHVRKAEASDVPAIAAIILPVIREAATYPLDPDMSEAEALTYWMGPEKETFVAEENGVVLGTYY